MKPIKITSFWVLLVATLLLQGTSIAALTTQAQAQSTTPKKTTPTRKRSNVKFKPPKGQPKPKMAIGGGRRNNGMCQQSGEVASLGLQSKTIDKALVPLLPSSKLGLTASSHPKFMVYVPQTSAKVLEFTFYNEEEEGIYQTQVNLENTPGIVSFSLPKTEPGLKIGRDYRFVVSIICQQSGPQNPFSEGLVRRISPDSAFKYQLNKPKSLEQVMVYSESGYWFEAVANLAELKLSQPNNSEINTAWKDLLTSVGLGGISQASLNQ